MRILTVSNCPALEHLGSGYIIQNFVNGLRRQGHDVTLLEPAAYEVLTTLRPRANSYRQALGMFRAVRRRLQTDRYDVVEFYGGEAWLALWWLKRRSGVPILAIQHTNGPELRYATFVPQAVRRFYHLDQSRWMRLAFTLADGIVTLAEWDRAWLIEQNLGDRQWIEAIEPCLDNQYLEREPMARDPWCLGYVGSWLHRKGVDVLAVDATRLLAEFPQCTLVLAGVGAQFRKEDHFPARVCGRIEVHPMVENKVALRDLYDRISILLMPSRAESFGLVTAEAMACGCAVVCARTGFGASLRQEQEALVLNDVTSPLLYAAARTLLVDDPFRRRIARNGWRRVQSLRWLNATRRLSDLYANWMALRSAKSRDEAVRRRQ